MEHRGFSASPPPPPPAGPAHGPGSGGWPPNPPPGPYWNAGWNTGAAPAPSATPPDLQRSETIGWVLAGVLGLTGMFLFAGPLVWFRARRLIREYEKRGLEPSTSTGSLRMVGIAYNIALLLFTFPMLLWMVVTSVFFAFAGIVSLMG